MTQVTCRDDLRWPPSSWKGGRDQIGIGGRLRRNPHFGRMAPRKASDSSRFPYIWRMSEPLVLHALRNKRAELSGAIIRAAKDLARLHAGLASLDHTILLFDPTAKPATIKLRQKRGSPPRFRAGEFSRAVFEVAVLRGADAAVTVREIAERGRCRDWPGRLHHSLNGPSRRKCADRARPAA